MVVLTLGVNESYGPMVAAIDRLLRSGEASGDFAPGADAEDVLLVLGFLWRIALGEAGDARRPANRSRHWWITRKIGHADPHRWEGRQFGMFKSMGGISPSHCTWS